MKRLLSFFLALIISCILRDISFADTNGDNIDLVLAIVNANRRDVILKQFPDYTIYLYEKNGNDNLNLYQICYNHEDGQMNIDYSNQSTYVWELYDDEMKGIEYFPEKNQIVSAVNATGRKLWGGYFDLLEVGGIVRNYVDTQQSDDSIIVYARFTDEEAQNYYGDLAEGYDVYAGFFVNKETLLVDRLDVIRLDEKDNMEIIESDIFEYGETDETTEAYSEILKEYRNNVAAGATTREVSVILSDDDGTKRVSQKVLKGVQFYVETPADYSLFLDEQYANAYNGNVEDLINDITLYAATEKSISKARSERGANSSIDGLLGEGRHGTVSDGNANGQVKETVLRNASTADSSSGESSVNYMSPKTSKPVTLKISGTAKLIDKNHVGSHWIKQFYLNGEEIKGTGKITVEIGDIINIRYVIIDDDSYPDTGTFAQKIEVTPEILNKVTKIEENIYVTENSGRYSGYSAQWKVVITIKP